VPDFYGEMSSASNNTLGNLTKIARLGQMGQDQLINADKHTHQMSEWGRQDDYRKAFSDAWASGDPAALDKVMGQYMEFVPEMQKTLGLRDDQHNQHVASFMMKLNGMANAGDAQGAAQLLKENQSLLRPEDAEHLSGAIAALGDPKKSGQAKQFLDNYSKSMIRASFKNPMQMMSSLLTEGRQDETELRDRWRHSDHLAGIQSRAENARYRVNHPRFAGAMTAAQQQRRAHEVRMLLDTDRKAMTAARSAGRKAQAYLNLDTPFGDANATMLTQIIDNPRVGAKINHIAESQGMTADGLADKLQQYINGALTGSKLTDKDREAMRQVIQAGMDEEVNTYDGEAKALYGNLIEGGVSPNLASTVTGLQQDGSNTFTKDYTPLTNNIPVTPPKENAAGSDGTFKEGTVIEDKDGHRKVLRNGEWVDL
jgi:hypothetical protein